MIDLNPDGSVPETTESATNLCLLPDLLAVGQMPPAHCEDVFVDNAAAVSVHLSLSGKAANRWLYLAFLVAIITQTQKGIPPSI